MTNTKSTRRALLASVVSILLCFTMLLGTTYAWFTDSVTSSSNIIQAGTLKVDLIDENDESMEGKIIEFITADNRAQDEILWEPGCTYETEPVYVVNKGNLDFKYNILVNGIVGDAKLLEAIEWTVTIGDVETNLEDLNGTLAAGKKSEAIVLIGHMKETAGNEYQNLTVEGISISVVAAQLASESDSFGSDYDKDAFYADALVTTDDELLAAIQDENVKVIAVDGNLTYDWGGASYENSKALLMQGKTFIGLDDSASITFAGYGSANPIVSATFKNITIKDATIGDNEGSWEHGYLEFEGLTASNVVFADTIMLDGNSILTNCSLTNNTASWYGMWIEGGNTILKDCSFDGTRAIKIHEAYGSDVASVLIDNCIFGALSEKPGVVIGDLNSNTSVTIKNSAFAEVQPGDQGKFIYETDTAVDAFTFVEEGNTIASSVTVSSPEDLATGLSGAGAAGAGNTVIKISADMDMTNINWTPVKVDGYHGADIITIDGQGHTITNLSAPLFAGGFAGGSGIVIKNLTIADSEITSTSTQGSGAFIECIDSMDVITLTNCHLKNSTVNGSRTGGLVGWTAGYNNVNDGPVKLYVTIEDCSVTECDINGTGSVGGIIGHSGGNAWTYTVVKNCVVENCNINSTDSGDWRTGVVFGTVNVGEQNDIINVASVNNTVAQTGKTAPAGQSNLYGRFVPGTTGNLTIDGVVID